MERVGNIVSKIMAHLLILREEQATEGRVDPNAATSETPDDESKTVIQPATTQGDCAARRARLRLSVTELSELSSQRAETVRGFESGECIQNLGQAATLIDSALWQVERARFGLRRRDQVTPGMVICEQCAHRKARPNDIVCRTCAKVLGGGPLPKRDALAFEEFRFAPPVSA